MTKDRIKRIAAQVRAEFEHGHVDRQVLQRLYRDYHTVPDSPRFVDEASHLFPNLNCGLTSLYLRSRLGTGEVIQGKYGEHNHTFLLVGELVVDITADQYGGPAVYVGTPRRPWSLQPVQV